jgi:hypothetical protein
MCIGCNFPIYNNSYNKFQNLQSDDGLLIFEDGLYGAGLKNITINESDVTFKMHNNSNFIKNNDINIIIAKAGRYFFKEGLFDIGITRDCFGPSNPGTNSVVLFLSIISGVAYRQHLHPTLYNKETKKNIPAIMYIDINPGDIVYIGNIDSRFWHCDIDIEDNFDKTKEKLLKTNPEITDKMIKNIMKKVAKPESCNFILNIDNYQQDKRYKKCLEDLKQLP